MSASTHPLPDPPVTVQAAVVDGNALVGILGEAFGDAAASLIVTCGSCHDTAGLSEVVVELTPTSAIVRCRHCTHTVLTLRWTPESLVLDTGSGEFTIPRVAV